MFSKEVSCYNLAPHSLHWIVIIFFPPSPTYSFRALSVSLKPCRSGDHILIPPVHRPRVFRPKTRSSLPIWRCEPRFLWAAIYKIRRPGCAGPHHCEPAGCPGRSSMLFAHHSAPRRIYPGTGQPGSWPGKRRIHHIFLRPACAGHAGRPLKPGGPGPEYRGA